MRGIVDTECAWAGFNTALANAKKTPTPASKAALLASRINLIDNTTVMITALQMSFADVGTLGTYMSELNTGTHHTAQCQNWFF